MKIFKDLRKFDKNKIDTICLFNTPQKDRTGRKELFKKQRKKYGFDERETWNLSYTSILWLYCHLKRYRDWSVVNMDSENVEISNNYTLKIIKKDKKGNYIYKEIINKDGFKDIKLIKEEVRLPYGKIIDIICEYFEYFINYGSDDEKAKIAYPLAEKGMQMYGRLLPSLWW